MTGEELKARLNDLGVGISALAESLQMSQPALSAGLKVKDIKTGLLEKICSVTGLRMSHFYPEEGITAKEVNLSLVSRPSLITESTTPESTINKLLEQNKELIEIVKNMSNLSKQA